LAVDFDRDVYCLLGLPFDAVDVAEVVRRLRQAARERRACFLSTPNLNFLIGCRSDSQFRDSVVRSDLSIADGMPLVWIARLLGVPIRDRTAGSSVFEALRQDAAERMSVFFFGGQDGVAETACRRLNEGSSGLVCAGYESPGFGSIDDMSSDATIARINSSGADFLVVSLGARKGQAWIVRNWARLSAPVVSHLGAVPNFIAGTVGRAPAWMQRAGLEWLWRIKEEPMLWRRYLGDGLALLALLATRVLPYAWYLHRCKADAAQLQAASAEPGEDGQLGVVRLRGAWTRSNLAALRDCFSKAVLAGKDLELDMAGVTYVDSAFVGLVMLLHGYQTQHGRRLLLGALPKPVEKVFRYCCAEYLCLS
jgi:N-acetylglucosaminyldiphosphoundecaprenol N-acetyl-beta-D-mannosaminyltransferase